MRQGKSGREKRVKFSFIKGDINSFNDKINFSLGSIDLTQLGFAFEI